jgi:hypothetical protein
MENQHRKITGYRELNAEEIALMNEIKELGPKIEEVIIKVQKHVKEQRDNCCINEQFQEITDQATFDRLEDATPERFTALAKTDFQTALMYLVRAVAQPTNF